MVGGIHPCQVIETGHEDICLFASPFLHDESGVDFDGLLERRESGGQLSLVAKSIAATVVAHCQAVCQFASSFLLDETGVDSDGFLVVLDGGVQFSLVTKSIAVTVEGIGKNACQLDLSFLLDELGKDFDRLLKVPDKRPLRVKKPVSECLQPLARRTRLSAPLEGRQPVCLQILFELSVEDERCSLFANHDAGGICVAIYDSWHHRGIGHS